MFAEHFQQYLDHARIARSANHPERQRNELFLSVCTNKVIKIYQSRGKGNVGERDIHRTPFEACAIPPFDPANTDHCELARLSIEAHAAIDMLKIGGGLKGGVVTIRRKARATTEAQIAAIDGVVRRILV